MRGLATLAVSLLLLPSASAVGALYEATSDTLDVTLAVVEPAAAVATPLAWLLEPVTISTSLPRPATPEATPPPLERDTVVDLPAEVPVVPDTLALHVDDAERERAPMGAKAERVDTQGAIGARVPVALPQARLPILPPAGALPLAPPARAFAPDAPAPASPPPAPETRTQTQKTPEARDPSWSVGAAAALAGLAIALLAPFLLYHRLRGARSLESSSRVRIVELLKATPGLSPAQVARALDVDPTTALYHLRFLVREGHVTAEGPRRGARYFAAGTMPEDERARILAVRGAEVVLETIQNAPGTPKSALAGKLAIARATLAWHLGRLERAGLVRYERAGRNVLVYPKESLSAKPSA